MALLLIPTIWTSACGSSGTTSSPSVATEDIDASMTASASEPGMTHVRVALERDDSFSVMSIELAKGERLEATFDGLTQTLIRDASAFDAEYITDFATASAAGPVQIRFFRSNGSIVDDSVVTLRPEFTVTSPTPGQSATFTSDLLLEWTPAQLRDVMRVWLSVSCATTMGKTTFRSFFIQVEDDGSELYDLSQIPEATDPMIDRSIDCTLNLDFQRLRSRIIAPPFEAGSEIRSKQSRGIQDITISS
jgi:hypothetical protein